VVSSSENSLYRQYQHDCSVWLAEQGIGLDVFVSKLADLCDGYDFEERGNHDREPYVMVQDVYEDIMCKPGCQRLKFDVPGWLDSVTAVFPWLREWLDGKWAEFGDVVLDDDESLESDWLSSDAKD